MRQPAHRCPGQATQLARRSCAPAGTMANGVALQVVETLLAYWWMAHNPILRGSTTWELVLPLDMVDNSTGLSRPISGRFFMMRQSRQAFSSRSKAPSELCWLL